MLLSCVGKPPVPCTQCGNSCVDLVTDPNALSIPPHITGTQMAGFALAATKIVLDGGVGQMLEMARANLRNIPGAELLS